MKKSIIITSLVLITSSLMAFSFMNRNQTESEKLCRVITSKEMPGAEPREKGYPDFFYYIGTRFGPIKKAELEEANSLLDFLPTDQTSPVESYQLVKVILFEDEKRSDHVEIGYDEVLTPGQKNLLQNAEVSTNFVIHADFLQKNGSNGKLYKNYFSPHLTVVPEKQAEYELGKEALIAFFAESGKESTRGTDENKLKPAKLYFTVTKTGTISNIWSGGSSGYPSIDNKMIGLIQTVPGNWIPAENSKGEKVDQELVLSYGLEGC